MIPSGERVVRQGRKHSAGFTIVEIVIAMFILAVFLLPLMQHFVRVRRVSLAARDAVIVNSFQTSCIGEIRMVDYNALSSQNSATLSRIIDKYSGEKTINQVNIQTAISIRKQDDSNLIAIDVESAFRLPGVSNNAPRRKVRLRSFAFPKP